MLQLQPLFFQWRAVTLQGCKPIEATLPSLCPRLRQGLRQGDWSARQRNTMERNLSGKLDSQPTTMVNPLVDY